MCSCSHVNHGIKRDMYIVAHIYTVNCGMKVEVALLSELEFKHQVTTAGGREGGGVGGMRALRCRGVQRTGSGMEGGEGEV